MIQFNIIFYFFIILFVARSAVQLYLHLINRFHLRKNKNYIPEEFKDIIDSEKFQRISNYTMESESCEMTHTLINHFILLLLLLTGILPWWVELIGKTGFGPIVNGLIFFGSLGILSIFIRIPFSLYENFSIEVRYGFNIMSLRLWLFDLIKSVLISFIIGGLILFILFLLIQKGGSLWWFFAWMITGAIELLILWLFPIVIAPLFNKFELIEDREISDQIKELMEKVGLRSGGVYKMDEAKRSKHTNAYFTGIGKTKRIVLYDTLLTSHPLEEIIAIVAHEIGHWKKKHILKQIIFIEAISFILFWGVSKFLNWNLPYLTFGFKEPIFYVGLFLYSIFISLIGFFLQPLESAMMRYFEREADDISLELVGSSKPICESLKRLASDNLENLTPHPLFVWYYYSHPPFHERISRLKNIKLREV